MKDTDKKENRKNEAKTDKKKKNNNKRQQAKVSNKEINSWKNLPQGTRT